jgi:iron complex outermembrane receptor protein
MGEGNELPQGKVLVYTSSAALAMAMFGGAAHAEEPAKAKDNAPEIVVTAQFRSQKLQDVPIAITAVNSAMLEQRGATNIADIGASAPNVTLRPAAASFGPSVVAYIRGVGQRDTNFALEPGVGLYIDDVYLPTMHGSLLNLVDLDRVEILRGPQGTLAGQNSIGGAIKLYSKSPMPTRTPTSRQLMARSTASKSAVVPISPSRRTSSICA